MKRITALVLTLALVITITPVAMGGFGDTNAQQTMAALGIMVGDQNGNLNLERGVSRSEFVKMAVAASGAGDSVSQSGTSPYSDVPATNWAAGYIQYAVNASLVNGYLDGTFKPNAPILLQDGVNIALKLLGYTQSDFVGAYPTGQMSKYKALQLDKNVDAKQGQPISRKDAMNIFYNMLTTKNRSGQVFITTQGYTLTATGEIDMVALINQTMKGPYVASSGGSVNLPFGVTASTKVYKNGTEATISGVVENDVYYYSKNMNTVWVYNKKATGTLEGVAPSTSAPSSVTLAGNSYKLATSDAKMAVSSLGMFKLGDRVTLLLDRDGDVAQVVTLVEGQGTQYGVVTEIGTKNYTDTQGNVYQAKAVTIMATDGNTHNYKAADTTGIAKGDTVRVDISGDNNKVHKASGALVYGTVSDDGKMIGSYKFAENAKVLDTMDKSAIKVYPTRLAGIKITEQRVRLAVLNEKGQVEHLILKDVTGDILKYGIMLEVDETTENMTTVGIYTYDIGGVSTTNTLQKVINATTGPLGMVIANGMLENVVSLRELTVDSVESGSIMAQGKKYILADNVAVYQKTDNKYYLSAISSVEDLNQYALKAYYEENDRGGNRIRVIVATKK